VREFDKKSYLDHNVIIPIHLTGETITLIPHYLGKYVKNVFRKSKNSL
jgi:hypothetical protein